MRYMIRKEYLEKFKKLYKDKYNIVLDDEEATELAQHFLNLMDILIHPKHRPRNTVKEEPDMETRERNGYASE